MPDGRRRAVWMPDELWAALVKAAAEATLERGKRVTVSEWIREALTKAVG